MKNFNPLSLLVISLGSFVLFAAPQTTPQEPTSTSPWSQHPKRPKVDRKALLARARRGDGGSQMWLGAGYEQGWFGKPNFHEALKWYRKAAAQGDPDAQTGLGQMYEDGQGVQQDYIEAAKWYRMAAEHVLDLGGAGQGRNNLGMLYLKGNGVPKDYVRAYMWFKLTPNETNLSDAEAQMTPAQIVEAERMAAEWKNSYGNK